MPRSCIRLLLLGLWGGTEVVHRVIRDGRRYRTGVVLFRPTIRTVREDLRWLWDRDAPREHPRLAELILFIGVAVLIGALAYIRIAHDLALASLTGAACGIGIVSIDRRYRRDAERWRRSYTSKHGFDLLLAALASGCVLLAAILQEWHLLLSALIFAGLAAAIFALKRRASKRL